MRIISLLLPILLLVSCSSRVKQHKVDRGPQVVHVNWFGQNCFLFTSSIGTTLLTDPFDPAATHLAKPKGVRSDIVLISQENSNVNHAEFVTNSPQVFRSASGVGANRSYGMLIRGVPTFVNPGVPNILGMNVIYTWTMDGVRFCHLGSLRNEILDQDIVAIGDVDVLFIPYGNEGNLTDAKRAKIAEQLRARIIVPMGARLGTGGLRGKVVHLGSRSFDVAKAELPSETTILVPASR